MQNQDEHMVESGTGTDDWENFRDNDIMHQQSVILAEEAVKIPLVGDKEPLSSLAAEYKSGNTILLEKIKVLNEEYAAIRRARGDGNCFFISFMFACLVHVVYILTPFLNSFDT